MKSSRMEKEFRIVAIISAYNEGDVIYHVIGDLVQQGIGVYFINHCSTDNTVEEASRWLGKGLLHIENFPQDAGYSDRNKREYVWSDILKRKQELAASIDANWFIHHDADEFRESPWPDMNLFEAIRYVDASGYNAIDFELLNFRPVDNSFVPGTDVRNALLYYDGCEQGNELQIKAWRKQACPVDLVSLAGHSVTFDGRRVCPVKFILRHYPVRSQSHGLKKVLHERKKRFNSREVRAFNWHMHYSQVSDEKHDFLYDRGSLNKYDTVRVRKLLLSSADGPILNGVSDTITREGCEITTEAGKSHRTARDHALSHIRLIRETLFLFHDGVDLLKFLATTVENWFRRRN